MGRRLPVPGLITLYARPLGVFFASDGGAFTSDGAVGGDVNEINSTSNTSIPRGSRFPWYASASGIQSRRVSPATMSCTPSVHPAITRSSGNDAGAPRATELSNIFPSVVQPV